MEECIFCKIIKKEIPCDLVAETSKSIAFLDVKPISDGHILVIPKVHFRNFSSTNEEYLVDLFLLAQKIAQKINFSKLNNWGINYLSNEESVAGQEIMHFHLHIIPKYGKDEGLKFNIKNRSTIELEKIKKILNK